jgi:long-chain acyl-CoA synthetase
MTADLIFAGRRRAGDDIAARARCLAGGLARMGVDDGDVIAVMLRNDPVYIDVIEACRVAGCYYCPINWHFKADEVGYLLQDSGAKVLIVHADLLPTMAEAIPASTHVLVVTSQDGAERPVPEGAHYHLFETWLSAQAPYDGPPRTPRAHMAYTSGTTGRPKGVRRFAASAEEHRQRLPLMQELAAEAWGITPGVRALVSAPLYHSAPTVFTQQAMLHSECLVLMPRFDAEQTLALIERYRVQTVFAVPIMFVRLLRLPAKVRAKYDLSSLRFVVSTGAPCAPEIKQSMLDWWGPVIYEVYASSETGPVTVQDPQSATLKPGSVGRPLGQAMIRIIGEDGRECRVGEVGTIYVRQPAYTDFTYQNNPAAREKIAHGELVTVGDMGYLDEDGYLYICDRASDMVISGGVNIYPAEIEHALLSMPGVIDCAVFGVPDAEYGEALFALVAAPEAGLTVERIQAHLRERLAGYKVPRQIRIVPALPRDDNGKLAKRRLREAYGRTPG